LTILTDHKQIRWIIARLEGYDYPLVFSRTMYYDEEGWCEDYDMYKAAMTATQADEILDLCKRGGTANKRKANTLLKRYVVRNGAICEGVGPIMLDDYVPDDWYDAWKEMETVITINADYPGYYEEDISTGDYF